MDNQPDMLRTDEEELIFNKLREIEDLIKRSNRRIFWQLNHVENKVNDYEQYRRAHEISMR